MSKRTSLNHFDSMELLQCRSSRHEFPLHYHDTFCLTLIHDGMMGENDIFAPAGTLLISHPFEVHQNRLIHQTAYSFTTFYISPDLFGAAAGSDKLFFKEKVLYDNSLVDSFNQLATQAFLLENEKTHIRRYEQALLNAIGRLAHMHSFNESFVPAIVPEAMNDVKDYIAARLELKISLTELSGIAGMDKFKFLRWFKKNTGLTPFNYIIINRIEKGKKMIRQGKPLIHAALDSGFYDQSHFTNYFKYFVGITPKEYQQRFNIFQDFPR